MHRLVTRWRCQKLFTVYQKRFQMKPKKNQIYPCIMTDRELIQIEKTSFEKASHVGDKQS